MVKLWRVLQVNIQWYWLDVKYWWWNRKRRGKHGARM